MSSCESVIFASRRRTACAVELPECRNVFLYVNFWFDSSFDLTGHGLLVRWSVIVSVASTSHELEKNVVCLNRSRRLGLTADGTFSGF